MFTISGQNISQLVAATANWNLGTQNVQAASGTAAPQLNYFSPIGAGVAVQASQNRLILYRSYVVSLLILI